jgi:urease accessory protein
MLKAVSVEAAGAWSGKPVDVVILDSEERTWKTATGENGARRFSTVGGETLEIAARHLPNIRTGDAFATEDGRYVEIIGKPEPLMEIRPADDAGLVRIAWQLGNHHLPMQIVGRKIRLRVNTQIAAVLTGLGAKVAEIEAPFDPEGGAYMPAVEAHRHTHEHGPDCGCGHDHGHDHHHGHDHKHDHHHGHDHKHAHAHDHSHDHAHHEHDHHEHKHDHAHAHDHGPGCGCGHHHHDHGHEHHADGHKHGHHHGHGEKASKS